VTGISTVGGRTTKESGSEASIRSRRLYKFKIKCVRLVGYLSVTIGWLVVDVTFIQSVSAHAAISIGQL